MNGSENRDQIAVHNEGLVLHNDAVGSVLDIEVLVIDVDDVFTRLNLRTRERRSDHTLKQ